MEQIIPDIVQKTAATLTGAGFEAYLVGGCTRDVLLGQPPKDWDIATNATPEQIQQLFPDSVYENTFGTVGVKTESEDPTLKIIEITTYRIEGRYSDMRHPDEVKFAQTIEEDLSRRDFTVNAIALDPRTAGQLSTHDDESNLEQPGETLSESATAVLIDPFHGRQDARAKIIRAVGDPSIRFQEDALRLLRAVRFMAQLGFEIELVTEEAIIAHASLLEFVSKERIRDEFSKLIMTSRAAAGVQKLLDLKLMRYVIPELEEGVGVGQNKHHIYTVFEHNLKSLEYAVKNNFPLDIRLSALLHDVAKPRTKKGDGPDSTFYGHQVVGERMTLEILDRLRFSKDLTEKVALLVREHMFVYDPETVTDAGARRLLRRVGPENIEDLFLLREADRIGSGVPKAQPYRLRHLKFRIEKVSRDPISAKMLGINGQDIMNELGIAPGPKIGYMLAILLEEVLDDPALNTKEVLLNRVRVLVQLEERQLAEMAKFAKKSADEAQFRVEEEIKKKYFVS